MLKKLKLLMILSVVTMLCLGAQQLPELLKDADKQLLEAATAGNLELLKEAIKNGGDVNAQDECGYTPIHFAIHNHHIDILDALLKLKMQKKEKIDLELEFDKAYKANIEYCRIYKNSDEEVADNLAYGISISYLSNGDTYAKFLEYGSNVFDSYIGLDDIHRRLNLVDPKLRISVLHDLNDPESHYAWLGDINLDIFNEADAISSFKEKSAWAKALTKYNVVNFLQDRAKYFATLDPVKIILGDTEFVKQYLNKFSPSHEIINIKDKYNKTALMWAVYRGHLQIVNEFLNYGNNHVYNLVNSLVIAQKHEKQEIAKAIYDNLDKPRKNLAKLLERVRNRRDTTLPLLPYNVQIHIAKFLYGAINLH